MPALYIERLELTEKFYKKEAALVRSQRESLDQDSIDGDTIGKNEISTFIDSIN